MKKHIGLSLGTGGALALSQIGVLKVIEREDIPIDMITGSSMGAVIGALWASGKTAAHIEEIILRHGSRQELLKLVDLSVSKKGLIRGSRIVSLLRKHLGYKTFRDLRIPLKIIACNIKDGREVVLDSGSLVKAARASLSIAGIFEPVVYGNMLLVDGGIVNPVPTNVLKRMGVRYSIAVNALPKPSKAFRAGKRVFNIFDIIMRSMHATECMLANVATHFADVTIHPIIPGVDWYEFYRAREFIKKGELEAQKALPKIRRLL